MFDTLFFRGEMVLFSKMGAGMTYGGNGEDLLGNYDSSYYTND